MTSFKEFMDEVKESPTAALAGSNITLAGIQSALTGKVGEILTPFSFSHDEKQKFSEEVSSLVENEAFLAEFSNQIGEPLENESEDEFVKRGSDTLKRMLYDKFGIKG